MSDSPSEPPAPEELTSLEDADAAIDDLVALLEAHEINVLPGSDLERGGLAVKYMADYFRRISRGEKLPPWPGASMRDDLQIALSIHNLAQLILAHKDHHDFRCLIPHLRLISRGAAALTKPARSTDQVSKKLIELRLALACLKTGSEVELDDPEASSGGKNPDVISRMSDNRRWGFACKVVHGDNPQTLWEAFKKGVSQIEASNVDVGLVVVSFKNKLDHDSLFPELGRDSDGDQILGALPSTEAAVAAHRKFVDDRVFAMVRSVTKEEIESRLKGSIALPAIAVPVETGVALRTKKGAIPSLVSYLHVLTLERAPQRYDALAMRITSELNRGLVAGRQEPR